MINIDLHIHSNHSIDGELSVSRIIENSIQNNIAAIALTDHNSVDAFPGAVSLGRSRNLEVIPGIEIDTVLKERVFHLLGYYIDFESRDFSRLKEEYAQIETRAFPVMVEKLNELGFIISWDEVVCGAKDKSPSEELLAEIILSSSENSANPLIQPYMKDGARGGMPCFNFYLDYMAPGKAAFVLRPYLTISEGVEMVRKNGGVPILAHPGGSLKGCEEYIPDIIDAGIMGLEVFSSYHDEVDTAYYLNLANENNLLITCGSDFHGKLKPLIELGAHGCTLDQGEILTKLKAAAGL